MPDSAPIRILSLDTATDRASVALLQGDEVLAELRMAAFGNRSARLLPSIAFLLRDAGWTLADLGLIAAGTGPGSFTGIRVGVATALGLAQALSLPFAGIPSLDALALAAGLPAGRLGVAMDARRAQVYYAEYEVRGRRLRRVREPALLAPEELAGTLRPAGLHLAGDGALLYRKRLGIGSRGWPRLLRPDLFLAASVGRLAAMRKRTWRTGPFLQAKPCYIRPPDALRPATRKI